MAKFVIEPHFRLQEWVAEEKGYFRAEGLDYEFRELIRSTEGQHHNKVNQGAFQSIEKGREADRELRLPLDRQRRGLQRPRQALFRRLFGRAVSDLRAGEFADPKRRPISPTCRFRSASSRAAITRRSRRSSSTCRPNKINLTFEDGMLFRRMEMLLDGKSSATALFNGPYYLAEQLGFRKIIDTTFMIASMINGDAGARRHQALFPRAEEGAARHRPAARALHPLLQERIPGTLPRRDGYAALGTRRTHRVRALLARSRTSSRSTGSNGTASLPRARWGRATTIRPPSR